MRITIVTSAFIPLPPHGGGAIEKVWDGLARRFVCAGHEVTFFCNRPASSSARESIDGVSFRRVSSLSQGASSARNVIRALPYAARVLLQLEEADILIVNDTATLALLPPGFEFPGKLVMNLQRLPKGPGMRVLYKKAWRLVAVSQAVRDAVERHVPDLLERTVVIGNPAHVDLFKTQRGSRDESRGRTIVYTGRIHPEKGLHLLAAAFSMVVREFAGAKLRIVGEHRIERGGGGPSYVSRLEHLLRGLDARILDPVNDSAGLAKVLAEADIYCYPSLAEAGETFGVAVLEACASGLAPVVSDLPAFREFVTEGVTGLVFDHRATSPEFRLAEILRHMLGLPPEELARMGEAATRVAGRYSYEKIAAQYLDLFESSERNGSHASRTAA